MTRRASRCARWAALGLLPALLGARLPDWAETAMESVDLEHWADADAIVVLKEWNVKLKGGERSGERRRLVHILNEGGADAAVVSLTSGPFTEYRNARLWVQQPGGETSKFSDEDGSIFGISDLNSLEDAQVLVIHPPGLVPGSTVAVEARFHSTASLPQDVFSVQEAFPVARAVIELDARGGWKTLAHVANGANPGPTALSDAGQWVFTDLPARSRGELDFAPVPPLTTVALDYVPPDGASPFETWGSTARWTEKLFELPRVERPAVRDLATRFPDSGDAVVEDAGRAARQLRYYAVELGWGSYVPRPPEVTLARSFGDCKDKTQLMIALLREAGIEAYPALVMAPSNGYVADDLPSPFLFNHVVAAIPWTGRENGAGMSIVEDPDLGPLRLYDATLAQDSPEDIALPLEGGAALILHPRTTGLLRLPGSGADDNVLDRRYRLRLAADGSMRAEVTVRASGAMRLPFEGDEGERIRPSDLRELVYERVARRVPGRLEELRVEAVSEAEDGSWSLGYTFSTPSALADFGSVGVLGLGELLSHDALPLPAEDDAEASFLPMLGTAREVYEVVADGWKALGVSDSIEVANELGHVRLSTRIGEGAVRIEREIGLQALEVPASRRAQIRELRNALRRVNAVTVQFETRGTNED